MDRVDRSDRMVINELAYNLFTHYNTPRTHLPNTGEDGINPKRKLTVIFLESASWSYLESMFQGSQRVEENSAYWSNWLDTVRKIKILGATISGKETSFEEYKAILDEGKKNPFSEGLYEEEARSLLSNQIKCLEEEIFQLKENARALLLEHRKKLSAFVPLNAPETAIRDYQKTNWISLSLFSFPKPTIVDCQPSRYKRRHIVIEQVNDESPLPYELLIAQGADAIYIIEEASFKEETRADNSILYRAGKVQVQDRYINDKRSKSKTDRISLIMEEALNSVNQELDPKKPSILSISNILKIALNALKEGIF